MNFTIYSRVRFVILAVLTAVVLAIHPHETWALASNNIRSTVLSIPTWKSLSPSVS